LLCVALSLICLSPFPSLLPATSWFITFSLLSYAPLLSRFGISYSSSLSLARKAAARKVERNT
jgi:hypothetical protein